MILEVRYVYWRLDIYIGFINKWRKLMHGVVTEMAPHRTMVHGDNPTSTKEVVGEYIDRCIIY